MQCGASKRFANWTGFNTLEENEELRSDPSLGKTEVVGIKPAYRILIEV